MTENRKPKTENPLLAADRLLVEMAEAQTALAGAEAWAALELERAQVRLRRVLAPLQERVARLDKTILQMAKQHQAAIFDGKDRVDLPHGALLHTWQKYVVKARGVMLNLKAQGMAEAIKVVETVKWEVLETWPEEKLILVGTERTKKEVFAYEVKG